MNIRLIAVAMVSSIIFVGCSAVNSKTVSDAKLQERAAFALGVRPEQVTISNRSNDGIRINFTATVGNRSSQCYVTNGVSVIGAATSDAICSGGAANRANKGSGGQCNALLKAAGRC